MIGNGCDLLVRFLLLMFVAISWQARGPLDEGSCPVVKRT
jgi:hypothetical protein